MQQKQEHLSWYVGHNLYNVLIMTSPHGHTFHTTRPLLDSQHIGPVMHSFDGFIVISLANFLDKQPIGQWMGCLDNVTIMPRYITLFFLKLIKHALLQNYECDMWMIPFSGYVRLDIYNKCNNAISLCTCDKQLWNSRTL